MRVQEGRGDGRRADGQGKVRNMYVHTCPTLQSQLREPGVPHGFTASSVVLSRSSVELRLGSFRGGGLGRTRDPTLRWALVAGGADP